MYGGEFHLAQALMSVRHLIDTTNILTENAENLSNYLHAQGGTDFVSAASAVARVADHLI